MICGNKVDMRGEREMGQRVVVTAQEGAQLAAVSFFRKRGIYEVPKIINTCIILIYI